MSGKPNKGHRAEELVRLYFLRMGYFVARGVPVRFRGDDITDVDLVAYNRSTSIARERINVDIKHKRSPQAMERILWANGLKSVLGFDRAIVATSDSRRDVREFGLNHHVQVLDGNFIGRLGATDKLADDRLTEEEFIDEACEVDDKLNFKKRRDDYQFVKSALTSRLGFDVLNSLLEKCEILIQKYVATQKISDLRLLYVFLSYFVLCVDYILRDYSCQEFQERKALLIDGIRYGESGKKNAEQIANFAGGLLDSEAKAFGPALRAEIHKQFENVRAEILAEALCSSRFMKDLFEFAKALEGEAFARNCRLPNSLDSGLRSVVGVLCDYFEIDRKDVLNVP